MINNLKFKIGSVYNGEALEFFTEPITVFIGPNNSGKSLILKEVEEGVEKGKVSNLSKILQDFSICNFNDEDERIEELKRLIDKHKLSDSKKPNSVSFKLSNNSGYEINVDSVKEFMSSPNGKKEDFTRFYLFSNLLKLDATNRFSAVQIKQAKDLKNPQSDALVQLFIDDESREKVRKIIYDAFGLYFTLDPTLLGYIKCKLSERPPISPLEERGIHKEAIEFHRNTTDIKDFSDGVRAYTGIIASILGEKPKIIVLDEPEAFLHPALAGKLGKVCGNIVNESNTKALVSTHSPNFLMGCIQSGSPLNVIRLDYSNKIGTARILDNKKLYNLMSDPLLRSTGVLSALFYKSVVVCEGDSDRAFYQEINERLSQFSPSLSIPDCLFINAVGKDTIWKIVQPLREMGIPAVGIYDLDVIKNSGNSWTNGLKSSFVPKIIRASYSHSKSAINKEYEFLNKDMKQDGGIDALGTNVKQAANDLFDELEKYGMFIVRKGEVESWLSYLDVKVHKSRWISEIFNKMGHDPLDNSYVKPKDGDVWDFIKRISEWMLNTDRKGIPS